MQVNTFHLNVTYWMLLVIYEKDLLKWPPSLETTVIVCSENKYFQLCCSVSGVIGAQIMNKIHLFSGTT